jgi:hypothetical protein
MRNRVGSNVDIKLSWEQVESRSEMLTGMWRLKESAGQPLIFEDAARTARAWRKPWGTT